MKTYGTMIEAILYVLLTVLCAVGNVGYGTNNTDDVEYIDKGDQLRRREISEMNIIKMKQLEQMTLSNEFNETDFEGRTITFATMHYPPFLNLQPGRKGFRIGGVLGSGQSWDLLYAMSEFFNFKPLVKIAEDSSTVGFLNSSGKWTGIIRLLNSTEAEVGLLPVTMSKERWNAMDFSIPMGTSTYGILAKRPKNTSKPDALLKPFNYEVWAWIMTSMVVMGPLIYVITKIRIKLCKGDLKLTRFFSLDQCIWFVFGAMMKQGSTLEPISDSSRILFATWWMFILIVTAFYTANLTAFLTFNGLDLPIKDINDLKQLPDISWLAALDGGLVDYIETQPQMSILREMKREGRGSYTNSRKSALEKVRAGTHIYLDDMRILEYLIYQDFIEGRRKEKGDRCDFYATPIKQVQAIDGEVQLDFWWGFGFMMDSSVKEDFNVYFKRMNSHGILSFLHQNSSGNAVCELPKGFKDRPLKNSDLLTTYYFSLIGIAVGVIIFVSECLYWRILGKKKREKSWFPSSGSIDIFFNKSFHMPPSYKGKYIPPYFPKLPDLPKSKPRTPFAVKYPEFAASDYNTVYYHSHNDLYQSNNKTGKGAKLQIHPRTLTDLHRTEMALRASPISREDIFSGGTTTDSIVEGNVNGLHVLWDKKDNKLIVKDVEKLRQHVAYDRGLPCVFVRFEGSPSPEKRYKFVINDYI